MKKVVLFGAKDIGYKCLLHLDKQSTLLGYKIVGVLTNNRGEQIKNYCISNNIKLLNTLEDFLLLEQVDIALSIQYHEILKKKHIEKVRQIIVNLHMAPLPEYRGCNQFSYAILDGVSEFGVTIHQLEEGIDNGGIISEKRFTIPENIWVKDLHDISCIKSLELFKETLPMLVSGEYKIRPQSEYLNYRSTSFHLREDINKIKEINLAWSKDKIEKHIRSTYMPGFESPYFIIDGKKIFFKLEKEIIL